MAAVSTSEVSPEAAVLDATAPAVNGGAALQPRAGAPVVVGNGRAEVVERATVAERRIYALEERLTEVELRLREQVEAERQKELELRAVERDVAVKEAYALRLEAELLSLREQLGLTYNHAANLEAMLAARATELGQSTAERDAAQAALKAAEVRVAELGALVAEIRAQATYKIAAAAAERLRRTGPLFRVARRVVRGVGRA